MSRWWHVPEYIVKSLIQRSVPVQSLGATEKETIDAQHVVVLEVPPHEKLPLQHMLEQGAPLNCGLVGVWSPRDRHRLIAAGILPERAFVNTQVLHTIEF